jgi:hypothetical protein
MEKSQTVRVLVAKRTEGRFRGFWAEFEGEKVSCYEKTNTRGEKNIVYTLYKCTAYHDEVYRVHIADESNPDAPVYELLPDESPYEPGARDYSDPWDKEKIAEQFPLFLKDMDYFRSRSI